jgi:hypothetical protein
MEKAFERRQALGSEEIRPEPDEHCACLPILQRWMETDEDGPSAAATVL